MGYSAWGLTEWGMTEQLSTHRRKSGRIRKLLYSSHPELQEPELLQTEVVLLAQGRAGNGGLAASSSSAQLTFTFLSSFVVAVQLLSRV